MQQTIYVVGHKEFVSPKSKIYKAIQVGSGEKVTELRDNIGINISGKNPNFCELTALYWIWKNDGDSQIIGLNHYRRFFSFKDIKKKYLKVRNIDSDDNIDNYVLPPDFHKVFTHYDFILPSPEYFVEGVAGQYKKNHHSKDLEIVRNIIFNSYPQYIESFDMVMQNRKAYICNMFITTRKQFHDYANWLFPILFEAEKHINLTGDKYQDRVFGFLAERLLNVYVTHEKMKILEVPTLFICDNKGDSGKIYKSKQLMLQSILENLL